MQDVLTFILGGGRGKQLYPLTKHRSEPAVPIAGKYRLIDIPISNCLNCGLNRIYILTQYLSVSLHRHIAYSYEFDPFSRGFVEVLAAQQTHEAADWYQGTADAVRQNLPYIQDDVCREVLLLSGDQLYHRDFRPLIQAHRDTQADVTIAVLPVTRIQAAGFGIVHVNDQDRVDRIVEKPRSAEHLDALRVAPDRLAWQGSEGLGREYLANMGIYVFKREVLVEILSTPPLVADLVTEVFPRIFASHRLRAHLFDGYWEDLGTIKSYFEANLALASDRPPFNFHTPEGVIYTRMRYLPAARVGGASLEQCLVSDGCTVEPGAHLQRCLIGVRSRIGRNVQLRDTIIIGADRFETDQERADNRRRGLPDFTVGDGCVIQRAILDKDCRIGENVQIVNRRQLQEDEGENYVIRDGIVVIPNGAVVPSGMVI
jgi:glucose-1-phosphate adenylyltransferase